MANTTSDDAIQLLFLQLYSVLVLHHQIRVAWQQQAGLWLGYFLAVSLTFVVLAM